MFRAIIISLASLFGLGGLVLLITSIWLVGLAWPRDLDGKYANSPLHAWFDSLSSGKGLCCSFADGKQVNDVDWDVKDGHYRVHLGEWIDVPDTALVTVPNKFGPAVVWPYDEDGHTLIRCFMPGAGT